MKTLFVFDRPLYPLRGGAEARALDHINYLESRGIKYDLFLIDRYYNYNQWDETGVEFILNSQAEHIYLHQVIGSKNLDTIYHKTISRFYDFINQEPGVGSLIHFLPEMIIKFRQIINSKTYDFIFFNHTYVSNALIGNSFIPCKTYIDTHDIYSNLVQEVLELQKLDLRVKYSGTKKVLSRIKVRNFNYTSSFEKEIKILCKFDKVMTISIDEYNILREYEQLSEKVTLIHKVCLTDQKLTPSHLDSNNNRFVYLAKKNNLQKKFRLLFFGSQYDPNVHGIQKFYYNILPQLNSEIELVIAGGISLKFANKNHPQVEVIGFVDDISSLYASIDAVIIPIFYGSGVSIKAVEALSYGKPVISTVKGVRGLSLQHEQNVLIAKNLDDFPELIEKLRLNPTLRQSIIKNALEYVEKEHSKNSIYKQMDQIFLS
jgi:glycosyltransferase involved in cell wall biosynthesis